MSFKLLIVDSNIELSSYIKNFLEASGHKIFCASNAQEAAAIVKKNNLDLIICETKLPDKNGYVFLKDLAGKAEAKTIPFVFFTSDISKEDVLLAKELGADAFLLKPLLSENILNNLNKLSNPKSIKSKPTSISKALSVLKKKNKKLKENDFVLRWINNKPTFVKVENIKYLAAYNSGANVFLNDGSFYQVRKTLTEIEKQLPEDTFIRIHRSYIINLNFVTKVENWFHNALHLYVKDVEKPFLISRRFASLLKSRF